MFIAIVMTGLDQNMMQKNLSCRSLREAKKNIYSFTGVMVLVNLLFVSLGVLLFHYAQTKGIEIPKTTDHLFPTLALTHLGAFAAMVFVVGLTAATFSSADSVLTTLTTSFCIDWLGMEERNGFTDAQKTALRHKVHIGFAVALWLVILGFKALNSKAVIDAIFTLASYTYGPSAGSLRVRSLREAVGARRLGAADLLRVAADLFRRPEQLRPLAQRLSRWVLSCSC
jgi:Na+/proline symporter